MHVLGTAATDPRVLREAAALVEAGYDVSIVDIEEEGHPLEELLQGITLRHVLMPHAFFSTRLDKSTLLRVTQLFFRTTQRLLQTEADIYHGHEVSGLLPCYIA